MNRFGLVYAASAIALVGALLWLLIGTPDETSFAQPPLQSTHSLRESAPAATATPLQAEPAREAAGTEPPRAPIDAPPQAAESFAPARPDEVRAAATAFLAGLEGARTEAPSAAALEASATLAEGDAGWSASMAAKYGPQDARARARERRILEQVLDWQQNGPFADESERFDKPALEALMRELDWLRAQG